MVSDFEDEAFPYPNTISAITSSHYEPNCGYDSVTDIMNYLDPETTPISEVMKYLDPVTDPFPRDDSYPYLDRSVGWRYLYDGSIEITHSQGVPLKPGAVYGRILPKL
jgi:hypothetical protein